MMIFGVGLGLFAFGQVMLMRLDGMHANASNFLSVGYAKEWRGAYQWIRGIGFVMMLGSLIHLCFKWLP